MQSLENRGLLLDLIATYHKKYRPSIFKSIEEPKFKALTETVEIELKLFVPSELFGVIWMFVQPFDELLEMKFAVDQIKEYWDSKKEKIKPKKLPIQSHRGYEPVYY